MRQICCFIDCKCIETCVPGGGPVVDGADAPRFDYNVQRAFYNGWKSLHGLKHQTVDIAHGLTIHMHGPTSVRRNDQNLFASSAITGIFNNCHDINNIPDNTYCIFGDSAYHTGNYIQTYYKPRNNAPLTAEETAFNEAMRSERIAIEWNYAVTSSLYRYLKNVYKLKVLQSKNVSKIYTVATLFKNFRCCMVGNQVSNYFHVTLPHYFLYCYIKRLPLADYNDDDN